MMTCPACGQQDEFVILARETVKAHVAQTVSTTPRSQAGELQMLYTDSESLAEWEPTSACTCDGCGHVATVADFDADEEA